MHPSTHEQLLHVTIQGHPPHLSLTVENSDFLQTSSIPIIVGTSGAFVHVREPTMVRPNAGSSSPSMYAARAHSLLDDRDRLEGREGGMSRETLSFPSDLGPWLKWRLNLGREDVVGLGRSEALV